MYMSVIDQLKKTLLQNRNYIVLNSRIQAAILAYLLYAFFLEVMTLCVFV